MARIEIDATTVTLTNVPDGFFDRVDVTTPNAHAAWILALYYGGSASTSFAPREFVLGDTVTITKDATTNVITIPISAFVNAPTANDLPSNAGTLNIIVSLIPGAQLPQAKLPASVTNNVPDPTAVGQMVTSNAADDWQLNNIDAVVAAANQHDLSVISVADEAGHFDISNFRYNPTAGTGATQPLNTFKTNAAATPSWVPVFNRTNNLPVTASYDSSTNIMEIAYKDDPDLTDGGVLVTDNTAIGTLATNGALTAAIAGTTLTLHLGYVSSYDCRGCSLHYHKNCW